METLQKQHLKSALWELDLPKTLRLQGANIGTCCSVTRSCPTCCNLMDCSLSASSVRGILQRRILEWVAIPYSRGSSRPRDQTSVSCVSRIGRPILYHWCHWEPSVSLSLLRFLCIQLVMPPNHLILCCHLLLFPSIFPSIRVFSSESVLCIRYCQSIGASASASILPKNTQSWFPLGLTGLRVQGTLKTLPNKLPNQVTQQ